MQTIRRGTWTLASALLFSPLAASAGSFDGNTQLCSSGGSTVGYALNAVESAILAASFVRASDQSNLLSKLANANSKTLTHKWSDAMDKLEDISSTANALASAAKPKLNSADAITAAALAAQVCISSL